MKPATKRLVGLVDAILADCEAGLAPVRGEAWSGELAGTGAGLWPPRGDGRDRLTPMNFLAFVDRCLLEILWEHNASAPAAPGRRQLWAWLGRRFRYREKIFSGLGRRRPADLNWLLNGSTVDRLVVLLTHACQLRCSYCTVAKYPADITRQVLRRACGLLLSSPKEAVWLQFFGGEPLLRPRELAWAADYLRARAARLGKTAGLGVTTNGLALDAERLDLLEKYGVSVEVSCDGEASEQSAGRPSLSGDSARDHARLMANLDSLRKRKLQYRVIMVVTPESLPRLGRNFRYLAAAGHRHIQVNYSLGVSWAPGAARRFAAALRRLDAWSRARGGAGAVNCTAYRREPVALNSELSCDCDGTLYRETGLCIERDFSAMKERFRVAGAGDKGLNAALLGNTQFDNFYMLTSAYAHDRRLLRLVMNNVGFGRELAGL